MTFSLDYRPRRDGQPYDPAAFGGGVDRVEVYPTDARTGVPLTTAGPATRLEAGVYRFTLPDLADGIYYTVVYWREAAGAVETVDRNDRFTLPVPDPTIARLRRLTGEPGLERYTDDDLVRILDENTVDGRLDLMGAAADVWEEKAATAVTGAGGRQVQSVTTGDQSVTYSGQDGVGYATERARYFRARSRGRTVRVTSPRARFVDRRLEREEV